MNILAIDTSSVTASVSVISSENVLSEKFINNGLTHSQTLMPLINDALNQSSLAVKDVDFFAVTIGPGSFTGVRIGISAVKGLADALAKKCIPVQTLEAIAEPLSREDVIACAVMDARCNQVYTASFNMGKRLCEDKAILIDELANDLLQYNKHIVFIGDGALLCYEKLKDIVPSCRPADENIRYIHGSSVGRIALKELSQGNVVSADDLAPFYLRLPQAERQLKKNNK